MSTTETHAPHPLADRFPMLPDEELARLVDDIRENGLRVPITLNIDGLILDGRNRYAACLAADVEPVFEVYEGDDEAAFVLSVNVTRRHLTTGQQAMSTALVLSDAGKRENGRWKYGAQSELFDSEQSSKSTWRKLLSQAGSILDHAPELAADVVTGDLALDAAYRQAESKRDAERQALAEIERMQAEEADARARLRELAPEYMKALDNGEYKSARSAFAAWEQENLAAAAKERQEKAAREAAEKQRRADLTHTYTAMVAGVQTVGSYGHVDVDDFMARFEPSLLHPPQMIRYLDVDHIRAGIAFLTNLAEWKASHV